MRGLQFLTLLLIGSLFALTGLRQFFVEPLATSSSNVIWFVIQVLPLLAVLPGVLRMKVRSYFFAVVAAMLYFIHGVMLASTADLRALGLWEVVFATALMFTATWVMRRLGPISTR